MLRVRKILIAHNILFTQKRKPQILKTNIIKTDCNLYVSMFSIQKNIQIPWSIKKSQRCHLSDIKTCLRGICGMKSIFLEGG